MAAAARMRNLRRREKFHRSARPALCRWVRAGAPAVPEAAAWRCAPPRFSPDRRHGSGWPDAARKSRTAPLRPTGGVFPGRSELLLESLLIRLLAPVFDAILFLP